MRLIYFNTTAEERPYAQAWSMQSGVEVTLVEEVIDWENMSLIEGHDGICLNSNVELFKSESFYQRLSRMGIRQIGLKSNGVDAVNMAFATQYGLIVTHVPDYSPSAVGHFTVMTVLMLLRRMTEGMELLRRRSFDVRRKIGQDIKDVTVGVVGTGQIGSCVADTLNSLGARVLAYSSRENPDLAGKVTYVDFDSLIESVDVLSLHIPLSDRSLYLIDESVLSRMKTGSMIVNTSRGKIIDTEALIHWLAAGQGGGAALDTLEDEEFYYGTDWQANPYYRRLIDLENVIITPHIAYHTGRAVKEMTQTALDNAWVYLKSGQIINQAKAQHEWMSAKAR